MGTAAADPEQEALSPTSDTETLLAQIDQACRQLKMAQTTFGRLAVNDGNMPDIGWTSPTLPYLGIFLLGVGLGMQELNVVCGGGLFLHLPEDMPKGIPHRDPLGGAVAEVVAIVEQGVVFLLDARFRCRQA